MVYHFKSDLVKNMEHIRISGAEPSSVITSQKSFKSWKVLSQKVQKINWSFGLLMGAVAERPGNTAISTMALIRYCMAQTTTKITIYIVCLQCTLRSLVTDYQSDAFYSEFTRWWWQVNKMFRMLSTFLCLNITINAWHDARSYFCLYRKPK